MSDAISPRELPRIYADFHGTLPARTASSPHYAVMLDTFGSLRDLSNAGIRLREGDRILIYADSDDVEDIECEAETYFDAGRKIWMAEVLEKVRDVPQRRDADSKRFLCVSCRNPVPIGEFRPSTEVCPSCGASIYAAIAPPEAQTE